MGLADRDYARTPPKGGGIGGGGVPRFFFTATTWLILINVAVFFVDRAAIGAGAAAHRQMGLYLNDTYTGNPREVLPKLPDMTGAVQYGRSSYFRQPVFDPQTREPAGFRIVGLQPPLQAMGYFSTLRVASLEVWRFVTFQFLHADFWHLAMNMIGLFFFGPIAERYLGSRRLFVAFYICCGLCGAGLYLILNLLGMILPAGLPLFLANAPWIPLVGASAGVFGVLWAAAYTDGKQLMYLFGLLPVRIDVGVAIFTALALVNLIQGGANAGGDAAHLGGAIAGAYFIRNPHLLINFFDEFFRTTQRHPKFGRGRAGKGTARGTYRPPERVGSLEHRVNEILDKIRTQGEGSLTPAERRFLEDHSKRLRTRAGESE